MSHDDDDVTPLEHPFAQYVRALGRGKRGARPLTQAEAFDAMRMILSGAATPEQIGAFLMLMRIKEETSEELAGIVLAIQSHLPKLAATDQVALLDWSAYAGKRRQLPWFVLSALLLAHNNIPVLLHGLASRADGRLYLRRTLSALHVPEVMSLEAAVTAIKRHGFAFIALESLSPPLARLIHLRDLLGLRSPVHSAVRMLNPLQAPYSLHGIFHPGYDARHQKAAILIGQPHLAVWKGDGGEGERNPDLPCNIYFKHGDVESMETWPPLFTQRHLKEANMDPCVLMETWQGNREHEYGAATVIATAAIALRLLRKANTADAALELARSMWETRNQASLYPPVTF